MAFTMTQKSEIDDHDSHSRLQSPRPGTPEPSSRQGRRNTQPDAQLLDDDGRISEKVFIDYTASLLFPLSDVANVA